MCRVHAHASDAAAGSIPGAFAMIDADQWPLAACDIAGQCRNSQQTRGSTAQEAAFCRRHES